MTRSRRCWSIFAAGAAALLAALVWSTVETLALEARELEAQREARFQESLRLALWTLDSRLTPILAPEAARPYIHYDNFYAPENVLSPSTKKWVTKGEVLMSSPLLGFSSEFFRLYFQIEVGGRITSPQVPPDPMELDNSTEEEKVGTARSWLVKLQNLGLSVGGASGASSESWAQADRQQEVQRLDERAQPQQSMASPQVSSANDFSSRWESNRAAQVMVQSLAAAMPGSEVGQGALIPTWHSGPAGGEAELFLLRAVDRPQGSVVQGVWVDWPRLRAWLLEGVRHLLPDARLVPAMGAATPDAGRLLASIPAALLSEERPRLSRELFTATRVTLLVTWLAVLAALTAVGLVLRAAMDLVERRGRFVSAVTHELRTPLTTFCMYSQMLADGMVVEKRARQEYLETLKSESERLTRVVESVLLYSRLEEGRGGVHREQLRAVQLLDRVRVPLSQRAAAAAMDLQVETHGLGDARVKVDVQAVEQILLNLVDNSCKYAAGASDRRLHLEADLGQEGLKILYRDHGPGIPEDEQTQVFAPFRRARQHAAGPVPGVGLGLPVAQGLARALKGELRLVRHPEDGAAFLLTLPLLRPAS